MTSESAKQEGHLLKFQDLLRQMFQFDCADLDFGIYRIMNYKRDAIEKFICEKLPARIDADLGSGALDRDARFVADLKTARDTVLTSLGPQALDADGQLDSIFSNTPAGREYFNAKAAAEHCRDRRSVEAAVYNHLYAFFGRYYQDGDFISRRRYSRNQRYAIPYNGEEVYLHWANSDQYYVKTGEHFYNYDWKAPNGAAVHFRLKSAQVEQDNVQGERRFFLPLGEEIVWDADALVITVPFEYRPLSATERGSYGARNQQDKIIEEAVEKIPRRLVSAPTALSALTGRHSRHSGQKAVSYLEHHLRQYTRRNDSDFFIHKDLARFLPRELDFYLKNEVLNLDNLEAAGEAASDGWFEQMRLIKSVGTEIIDFLAQLEDFQKMVWEKRKFVVETQYCVRLGSVSPAFYPEIAGNDAQWREWRELMGIDNSDRSPSLLQSHPTLPLDTFHFDADFTDRLLASFDDLDGTIGGLVVHSENWQALQLLHEKYRESVKCVHIDPPYNTSTSGFLYKNGYQHSSWLAMMHDRTVAGSGLMHSDGAILCHIDENEYEKLHVLFTSMGVPDAGTIIWDKKNPMLGRRRIATQHEYILWRTWNESSIFMRPVNIRAILDKAEALVREHAGVTSQVEREFRNWVTGRKDFTGGERAYQLIDKDGRVFRGVAMGAPEPRTDPKFHIPLIHPATQRPMSSSEKRLVPHSRDSRGAHAARRDSLRQRRNCSTTKEGLPERRQQTSNVFRDQRRKQRQDRR